ncbi:MAG: undecaprenyldiphospho-muramoylpentapeptide beta-N-acetylglucosaminyltransferase [Bacteroidia bacterium]|jgi:UDP-N-acetylglucosamine--N-acetylmuramyl-(pentapeptide) pyrophosphoryl-undecaprenol N-acetylglucosamine transferase
MNTSKKLKFIVSGGGTGGHIYPAVAVAQAIRSSHPDAEILFVGASDRMEMEKVPKAGFPIIGLWISGLQRSLSPKNFLFPLKVIHSVWKSLQILREYKPDVAIGFGGYASGALLYAATMRDIPTLIHEQNSYAGITNKILRNRVNTICVAYDRMERFFPERKIVKTGNPIRKDLIDVQQFKKEAYTHFGLDSSKKTVLVIGGSLGARTINESMLNGINEIHQQHVQVIWQTGLNFNRQRLDPVKTLIISENNSGGSVNCQSFIYEMHLAYAAADVVISRAGALSIAEIAQVKKPVILVPSPNVAEDHQTKNAMALVEQQAALMVRDQDARSALIPELISLMNNPMRQAQLRNNIAMFAMPDAAGRIEKEVLKLIHESSI